MNNDDGGFKSTYMTNTEHIKIIQPSLQPPLQPHTPLQPPPPLYKPPSPLPPISFRLLPLQMNFLQNEIEMFNGDAIPQPETTERSFAPPPPPDKIDNLSPNWAIMLSMQENINNRIGTNKTKKYISAVFWDYISTPINFGIMLLTAISAGQIGSDYKFLTQNDLFLLLTISFVLSTINSFFRLKEKSQLNFETAKIFETYGSIFENIYFTPILCNHDVRVRLKRYMELQQDIDRYQSQLGIDSVNYLTEIIYFIHKHFFQKHRLHLQKNRRFWFLDSRKSDGYKNNYDIDLENFLLYPDQFPTGTPHRKRSVSDLTPRTHSS
jgi:hypothetical protein